MEKVNVCLRIARVGLIDDIACALFSRVDSTLLNFNIVDSFLYKYNQYPYLTISPDDKYGFDKYIINILQEMGAGIEMKQLNSLQNDFGDFGDRYKDITFYPYVNDDCGRLLIHPEYIDEYLLPSREIRIVFDNLNSNRFNNPAINIAGLFNQLPDDKYHKYVNEELEKYHLKIDDLCSINVTNITEKDWTVTKKLVREHKYFYPYKYIKNVFKRVDVLF